MLRTSAQRFEQRFEHRHNVLNIGTTFWTSAQRFEQRGLWSFQQHVHDNASRRVFSRAAALIYFSVALVMLMCSSAFIRYTWNESYFVPSFHSKSKLDGGSVQHEEKRVPTHVLQPSSWRTSRFTHAGARCVRTHHYAISYQIATRYSMLHIYLLVYYLLSALLQLVCIAQISMCYTMLNVYILVGLVHYLIYLKLN